MPKHLLTIDALEKQDILNILKRAQHFSDAIEAGEGWFETLKNRTVLSLFFENSTRTRASFEMAAKRLGATWMNLDIAHSSTSKGETLMDTVHNMQAICRPSAIIVRHHEYGAPDYIAGRVNAGVVNAGDSWRAHPTQALLDALTITQAKGKIEGLTIAICGDIAHSRVAASNMQLLTKLGAHVRAVAPPVLIPQKMPVAGVEVFDNMDDGLKGADIVMMLRIQKERMQSNVIESDDAYFRDFGLTHERLKRADKEALVMHPGPMNRGVEISDDIADDKDKSLILKQASNGIPTRMAVLEYCCEG